MNASAPAIRSPARRTLGWVLLALCLAVYFYVPVSAVLDASLDASNYASYTRFAAQRLQFGTEVVPMAGPYGFVFYGWVFSGDLYGTRLVLEFITKLALALLVLWFFQRTRGSVTGWLWLIGNLLVLPTTHELTYDLPVLYGALFLLFGRPRWPLALLTVSFLAFLALCKGTQLIFTLAVLAVVCAEALWRRAWRELANVLGGFFGALVLLWTVAGQNLGNLPAYIRNIQELSTGYVSGMALQESSLTFVVGVASLLVAVISLALLLLPHRRQPAIIAGTLVLAGFTFLQWKHGFVRADGHVFLFFHYCIIGGLTALALDRVAGFDVRAFAVRAGLCGIAVVLALHGNGEKVDVRFREYANVLIHHVPASLRQIVRPSADRDRFTAMLEENRERFALPNVSHHVGNASIGFFGYQSGYLPLNQLNETPSPVAGGGPFSVFTPHLQKVNAQHVLSPETRPEFTLIKLQTIDDRFIAQDDAPRLNAIFHTYRPVLAERGMLLMKSDDRPSLMPPLRKLQELSFRPGDEVKLPEISESEMLLAEFHLPWSAAGLLRSAWYKSGIVTLHIDLPGPIGQIARRIIPSMASAPFIISPILEETGDLLSLYTAGDGQHPRSLRISSSPSYALAENDCTVTFYAQRRPTPLSAAEREELAAQFNYPMANRPPALIEASNAQTKEVDGRMVQLLEPPGRMVFNLQGDERELQFDYGFDPESYTRGTTDGADFIAELIAPGEPAEQLFLSRRTPKTTAADRGRHHAQVWLPVLKPGMQLQMRTTGGEKGAGDWDWTFFDNIQLHRGPLQPEQFPGFSTAPVRVEGAEPRMIEHENRPVLLLNAPGKVVFALTGSETAVVFSAGLIPGAYLEGNCDGVEFIVELQTPDGAITPVFQRWLQPKTVPTDRGIQTFHVSLPPPSTGAELTVRTGPGPHGDASWDWSYLAELRFEKNP